MAFPFGDAIATILNEKHPHIDLIYTSRYGATADNAASIAEGVGRNFALLHIEAISVAVVLDNHDYFIVGSGVWREGVHASIRAMMTEYAAVFNEKLIASFVVCGTQPISTENKARIAGYLAAYTTR